MPALKTHVEQDDDVARHLRPKWLVGLAACLVVLSIVAVNLRGSSEEQPEEGRSSPSQGIKVAPQIQSLTKALDRHGLGCEERQVSLNGKHVYCHLDGVLTSIMATDDPASVVRSTERVAKKTSPTVRLITYVIQGEDWLISGPYAEDDSYAGHDATTAKAIYTAVGGCIEVLPPESGLCRDTSGSLVSIAEGEPPTSTSDATAASTNPTELVEQTAQRAFEAFVNQDREGVLSAPASLEAVEQLFANPYVDYEYFRSQSLTRCSATEDPNDDPGVSSCDFAGLTMILEPVSDGFEVTSAYFGE